MKNLPYQDKCHIAVIDQIVENCIGGVMVSMLALSALDCDSSPDLRARTGWLEIRIMCLSGSICLYMDCCLSELAIQKSNYVCWPGTKHTLSST